MPCCSLRAAPRGCCHGYPIPQAPVTVRLSQASLDGSAHTRVEEPATVLTRCARRSLDHVCAAARHQGCGSCLTDGRRRPRSGALAWRRLAKEHGLLEPLPRLEGRSVWCSEPIAAAARHHSDLRSLCSACIRRSTTIVSTFTQRLRPPLLFSFPRRPSGSARPARDA